MANRRLSIALTFVFVAFEARAEDSRKQNWHDEGELSFTNTTGNSRAATFGANNLFNYNWERTGLELKAGIRTEKDKGRVIGEEYNASEKVTRKVIRKIYGYELFRWDRDRFSGVRNRHGFSLGAGDELWRTEKDKLIGEAGMGYISEERPDRIDHFASGRLYGKYSRALSKTAKFAQDAEYLHSFEDSRDYRINTETAITAAVSDHVLLKASYKWKKVGNPAPGFVKDDTTTGVALVINY